MAYDANFKPSLEVDKFLPEDYSVDSERFVVFLRAYYEWLQTTKVTISEKIGTFVRDESVVGSQGAIGVIKEVGSGYLILKMTSRLTFNRKETITGATSGATATVETITDNVVRASGNISNYKNFELSIDKYFNYLQDELFPSLPATVYGDKRLLATKYKNFFETRSNEESYRFLFKLLYNEDVEFYYPGEDVLRVSDGNFEKTQILRAAFTSDIFDFLNKTIRGTTSGSLANVVDIKVFNIASLEVAEMTLKLVSGTFSAGETIVDIDDPDLSTTLYGMITGFTINDGGSGYQVGDTIVISGDGSEAEVVVSSIKDSPISALKVNQIGHGYRLNTDAIVNNSGTGGSGLQVRVTGLANTYTVTSGANTYTLGEVSRVSIVNRGENYFKTPTITLQDTTVASLGLLSDKLITIANSGIDYTVGDALVFTGGSGSSAAGQVASVVANSSFSNTLLFEDDFEFLLEQSYDDKLKTEDWSLGAIGPIARIELTNFGTGYESANLPSITITTSTGSGASLVATDIQGKSANVTVDVANNVAGIGAIRALEIKDFGLNYTTATANAVASGDGNANLTPVITSLGIKEGNWTDDDGKIDYKFIQDSFFYQDFSYVIKSGLTFNFYKDTIKKIIHPAGLQPFGEILLFDQVDVSSDIVVTIVTETQEILDFIVQIFSLLDASANNVGEFALTKIITSDTSNVASNLTENNQYVIGKFLSANASSSLNGEYRFLIEVPIVAEIESSNSESRILISQTANCSITTLLGYPDVTYGEIQISLLAGDTISSYSTTTFDTIYQLGSTVIRNTKIDGNVSVSGLNVIGNGTSFTSDFSANDFIIIDNSEKFIINSISNNTFMTINVPASGTFINADAYKQEL